MRNDSSGGIRVLGLGVCAERADQSLRTLQRQIAEGKGPPIVEISQRRRGILESDFEAWLLARRRPAPTLDVPVKRGPGRPRKFEPAFPPPPDSHAVGRVSNDPEHADSRASSNHRESLPVGRDGKCHEKP
jgi:hypothetical protein